MIVNYETRELVSHLIFSLYRILGPDCFSLIVVVDNASRDGSAEMLSALHNAGLVHLIRNRRQRYHGPALNQALSWLARRQSRVAASDRIDYVWLLDSDVVILRRAARDAVEGFRHGAAMVGQDRPLLDAEGHALALPSLMFDPAKIWRRGLPPFRNDGNPSDALQAGVGRAGLRIKLFPFISHSYVLHLGRGTLIQVAESGLRDNRFYEWSLRHRYHNYNGHPLGPELHAQVLRLYGADVPTGESEELVRTCRQPALYEIEGVASLPSVRMLLAEAFASGEVVECPSCQYPMRADARVCVTCAVSLETERR